ncbi:hypothetical protein [Nocardioides sp. J54]|uniref:hypothetical protein n=1 Tax=Nocardioides sp. J54 TaxID=935866 RepID=UPI00049109E3|nr:hypothetical protein [Nocardioides sp. J54]
MGLNTALVALTGVGIEDLARLGVVPTGRATTGDEAMGEERPHAAIVGGRLVLTCADPRLLDVADVAAVELGAPLAGAAIGSTADVFVLRFRDGARARERVLYGGETVSSDGEPWPVEAALDTEDFPEDGVLAVLHDAAGIRLDDAWAELELQELDWVLPGEEDGPAEDPPDVVPVGGGGTDDVVRPDEGSRFVPIGPVASSSRVVAVALAVGLAVEVLLALLVATTDLTFGPPVPHALFLAIAGFTLVAGRLNPGALVVTALEALVLLATVLVALARGEAPAVVLLAVGAYLVVLAGLVVRHLRRVLALQRALGAPLG